MNLELLLSAAKERAQAERNTTLSVLGGMGGAAPILGEPNIDRTEIQALERKNGELQGKVDSLRMA